MQANHPHSHPFILVYIPHTQLFLCIKAIGKLWASKS